MPHSYLPISRAARRLRLAAKAKAPKARPFKRMIPPPTAKAAPALVKYKEEVPMVVAAVPVVMAKVASAMFDTAIRAREVRTNPFILKLRKGNLEILLEF